MALMKPQDPNQLMAQQRAALLKPPQSPGVRTGTPGPASFAAPVPAGVTGGIASAAPAPTPAAPMSPIITSSAQAAKDAAAAANAASQSEVSSLSSQQYGRGGGISPGTSQSLEDQIRGALTGMFSGGDQTGFVNRSKQALGESTEAQRAQAVKRINDDAISRGLFRSGIPAELAGAAGTAAQGSFSKGLADILGQAEQNKIQGQQFATGQASNLLGMNRSYDQYLQQQIEAARGRGGGGPGTTTIIDPDTGQSYEVSNDALQYL